MDVISGKYFYCREVSTFTSGARERRITCLKNGTRDGSCAVGRWVSGFNAHGWTVYSKFWLVAAPKIVKAGAVVRFRVLLAALKPDKTARSKYLERDSDR